MRPLAVLFSAAALSLATPIVAAPALAQQAAPDLTGIYTAEGANPGGGGTYVGTASIQPLGENWRITWQIGNDRYVGIATVLNGVLAVAVPAAGQVAAYRIARPGVLEGRWAIPDHPQAGTETLTKR